MGFPNGARTITHISVSANFVGAFVIESRPFLCFSILKVVTYDVRLLQTFFSFNLQFHFKGHTVPSLTTVRTHKKPNHYRTLSFLTPPAIMAKPIILATLLAAASVLTAGAFNVKNVGHPNQLIFTGEAPAAKGPGSDGYWTDLFSPPYGDCPTVMIAIGCSNTTHCYIPGGQDGVGFGVMEFDGQSGGKFTPMPMPSKPMMLMAIGMGGDVGSPRGAVGGMGFGNGLQYLKNGHTWEVANTTDAPLFYPTQCIRASTDGRRVITVMADNLDGDQPILLYSTNGGQNFTTHRVNVPLLTPTTGLRYAAIPSEDVWYVTAGTWPSTVASAGGNNVFASPKEARRNGVSPNDAFALSDRLALVRDAKTNTLKYQLRDVVADRAARPPVPKAGAKGTPGYTAQILRTTDGGKTFKSVFEDLDNFYFNGIECTDVKTCYAVGAGDDGVYIYATKDGGDSWRVAYEMPATATEAFSLMSIAVTEGTVIAAGGGKSGAGYESFTVTSDDGINWSRQEGLPGIGDIAAMSLLPGGYGFGTAVTVYQASTVLALRPKGSPTLPPPPTQARFSQINCDDDKCSEGCQTATFPQNKCLTVSGGGSALVTCDKARSLLVQSFFAGSQQCRGNSTERSMPLNVCLHSNAGGYFENVC